MNDRAKKSILEGELGLLNEQIKLMNQLAGLYANQSKYENDATESRKNRERIQRKIAELERNGIRNIQTEADLDRRRLRADHERLKLYQEMEEVIENTNKKQEESLNNRIKQAKEYKKQQEEINKLEEKADKRRREIARQNPNASSSELNRVFSNDAELKNILKNIGRKESQNNTSDYLKDVLGNIKIGNSNVSKYVEMNEKGISTSAMAVKVVVDTFSKAVQVFSNAVSTGFKNQTGNYENNFTNIAVRTGMSKSTYIGNQMSLGGFGTNILHERGLMNNIRTSDVQEMWNSLANKGLSQEDVLATSLEAVITKTIVPYLDVTTEEMQQFNLTLGENGLLKQVRGINKVSQEEFGSSMITQKYMQDALEYMSPMADAANLDLLKNTVGGVEMLQYLQSEEGGGLSTSAISKLYQKTRKLQEDLPGALSSGDTSLRLAAAGVMINGVNQYENMPGVMNQLFGATNTLTSILPNNANLAAFAANGLGINGTEYWEYLKKNPDFGGAYAAGMGAAGRLSGASQEVTNALANDEFHTTKQLTDILAENVTNEVSAFAQWLGPWFEVLTTALQGIASILGIKLAGKIGGKLLGIGGSAGKAGFLSNFANGTVGTVGGTLGNGLMNIGLASGYSGGSVAASQLIGAVPVAASAAGIAGGGYMIYDGIKRYNAEDATAVDKGFAAAKVAGGTAGVAGGLIVGSGVVAGLAGAGAANAWNPVGWGLLIAAGVTAVATALYEHQKELDEFNDSLKDTVENNRKWAKDVTSKYDTMNQQIDEETKTQTDYLDNLKTELERGKSYESVRNDLINSGLLSQEDINKAREADKEALEDLVDKYLLETGRLGNEAKDFNNEMKSINEQTVGSARREMIDFIKNNYADASKKDQVLAPLKMMYESAKAKERSDASSLSDADKEIIKWYEWANEDNDISAGDIKDAFEGWDKIEFNDKEMGSLAYGITQENLLELSNKGGYGGAVDNYKLARSDEAIEAKYRDIIVGLDKKSRDDVVTGLNAAGYAPNTGVPTYWKAINTIMETMKGKGQEIYYDWDKAKYYRIGTDSIPYDNYPALLHEGEAVLTASTANELRSLVDEYRNTKYDSAKIEKAIQDQTAVLVERLDAIYLKIPTSEEAQAQEVMPGNLQQNYRKMSLPFN